MEIKLGETRLATARCTDLIVDPVISISYVIDYNSEILVGKRSTAVIASSINKPANTGNFERIGA